jgi:hypothetical protein
MESVDRSARRLRQLLVVVALVAALYVWAFGFKERAAHLDFMAERQAQKSAVQTQTIKTSEQAPKSVAPEQMPSGLYPAFLQAQQTPEHLDNYAIASTERGLEAKNPANGFNSRFTGSGVEFDGWQMHLSGLGWAGQNPAPVNETAPVVKDNRVEYHRMGGLTEWYLNGPLGLEQGFTLAQPLAAPPDDGWLSLELSLQGATATPTGQGDWLALNPANGPALRYGKLYAYDAGGASLPAKLEVKPGGKGLRLLANLQGARFPVTVDPFVQQELLTASDGAAGDYFGNSVALNSAGDIAFIGAPYKRIGSHPNQGAAYVFIKAEGVWSQKQILTDTAGLSADDFGWSVALNSIGDTALIGAYGKNTNQGWVYIFTRSGMDWSQQQIISDTITGADSDNFGTSVALNSAGDIAVIGAYNKKIGSNVSQGAAYIFTRNGTIWSQQQIISDTVNGSTNDYFGFSVALDSSGDTALIGAYYKKIGSQSNQGAAYIFTRNGTVWSQQQMLTDITTGAASDYFGYSVALNSNGDTALIGANFKKVGFNYFQGAAYIFTRISGVWSQNQILTDTLTGAGADQFGSSVALNSSGDIALIGANFKNVGANIIQGAAYIFTRNGSVWSQQQIISDTSTGTANDYFGSSAALDSSGDTALIGAKNKRVGSNYHEGATYIFQLQPTTTTLGLTSAPNPSTFGRSVTFTATVSPITATGTVTFTEGSTILGTGTLFSGVATFSTSSLSVGSHVISATYSGDNNYTPGTSNSINEVVNPGPTTLNLTSAPNPSLLNQFVTFSATISPITATGTVTFTEGATVLGAATLSGGIATFTTSSLSVGSHVISATYGGDSNLAYSSSSPVTQVVNKAATTLDLTSAPNPSTFGQVVTFTATVSPIAATGTVTFTEGTAILGTSMLSSGVATFATAGLPVGSHVISATYGGDSNFTGSASPTITQVVGCNPNDALVTNIGDDGTGNVCGSFSYALVHASPGVTITFMLTQSNTITFSGSLTPTVPVSVTIDGGSGAGIVLDGNGMTGDGLRLSGDDTLINLTIKRFGGRELVTLGPGNRLRGVRISQT